MRSLALLIILTASLFTGIQPAHAQQPASLPVTSHSEDYKFGSYINFQAQINLDFQPAEAYLLFRADGEASTREIPIQVDAQGNISQRYENSQGAVRPFATVRYFYRVKQPDGQFITSDEYSFAYVDNRFAWQVLSSDEVNVRWYDGDTSFGQAALDVARAGIQQAKKLLPVNPTQKADLYIYASSADLAPALEVGGQTHVGGHASPDLQVALVVIPPGPEQKLEMEKNIPHELAHILTYDLMNGQDSRLPAWLSEGIATQAEIASDPDYTHALANASAQAALIPINDLCGAFPADKGQNTLAYAESQSFTRYIVEKYGQSGLIAMTTAFGDGLNCAQGLQQALGKSLPQVEQEWHNDALGENPGQTAFYKLFPYLATLLVLLTVSLVSAFSIKRSSNG